METLESLRAELGASADIVLLIGADQHARLETWHRWRDLFDLARIAVFARPGLEPSAYTKHVTTVPMPALDISSSEIRKRLANGESARGLLPDSVLDYIDRENLYRRKPTSSMEGQTR